MIFDRISNIKTYKGISSSLDMAIDAIAEGSYKNSPVGKYEISGKDVFYMVQEYTTKNIEDCSFETHNSYIDIQLIFDGEENMAIADLENLEVTAPFNPEKDVEKQKGNPENTFKINPERFIVFFPGEAHMPCIKTGENSPIKKAVFKIKK